MERKFRKVETYEEAMRLAVDVAKRHPARNKKPYVGAVIIDENGSVIGEGTQMSMSYKNGVEIRGVYCANQIKMHAERITIYNTLINLKLKSEAEKFIMGDMVGTRLEDIFRNTMMFVTLEPCLSKSCIDIQGCSELIVNIGIKKVIIGRVDGRYNGAGINYLRDNGVRAFIPE